MDRFAVILSHNRPELLRETVAAIGPQVDMVIVIDNASDPPVRHSDIRIVVEPLPIAVDWRTIIVTVPDQPPNLAALWQRGIDAAEVIRQAQVEGAGDVEAAERAWHIAFLCDDAPPPAGWYAAVVEAMAQTGATIGCSNPWGHPYPPAVKSEPDYDLMGRMPGWAFVLDPQAGVRPDQSMHWWWLDTDIDFQARKAGGMVMIGGHAVPNARPNEYTAARPWAAERIGLDAEAFVAKWGFKPW